MANSENGPSQPADRAQRDDGQIRHSRVRAESTYPSVTGPLRVRERLSGISHARSPQRAVVGARAARGGPGCDAEAHRSGAHGAARPSRR